MVAAYSSYPNQFFLLIMNIISDFFIYKIYDPKLIFGLFPLYFLIVAYYFFFRKWLLLETVAFSPFLKLPWTVFYQLSKTWLFPYTGLITFPALFTSLVIYTFQIYSKYCNKGQEKIKDIEKINKYFVVLCKRKYSTPVNIRQIVYR